MHGAKIKMNTTCQKNGQAGMKYQPAGKSNPERPSMGLLNCKQKCDVTTTMTMMIKYHSKKPLVFLIEQYS
jgi:hypothetical protein